MAGIYSVGQVNTYIRNMFEQDFLLRQLQIKGEVSNCKYHTSGHIYFSLKDGSAALACVMFASARKGLAFELKNGMQVIVTGQVSVYERAGNYQLYAKAIKQDGIGILYEQFEILKQTLEEMGMFDSAYKLSIPKYSQTIGIVTAPTGAAIRDIIQISRRRNPCVQLILYPALVQGAGAAESIAKGIQTLDQKHVDTIIVGRGGGSLEDLWAFNEEVVARAIFACQTPVISAVGHETDTTIADYVADLRAPTPSAAAELAVFSLRDTMEMQGGRQVKLTEQMSWKIKSEKQRLLTQQNRLQQLNPENLIREKRMQLLHQEDLLKHAFDRKLLENRKRLQLLVEQMKGLSPLRLFDQGYAKVYGQNGENVAATSQVSKGQQIQIYVSDGRIKACVEQVEAIRYPEEGTKQ